MYKLMFNKNTNTWCVLESVIGSNIWRKVSKDYILKRNVIKAILRNHWLIINKTKSLIFNLSNKFSINITEAEAFRLICYFEGDTEKIIDIFDTLSKDFILSLLMEWEHDILGKDEINTKYQYWKTKYPYWEEERFLKFFV